MVKNLVWEKLSALAEMAGMVRGQLPQIHS
jgi:hypothetical protein